MATSTTRRWLRHLADTAALGLVLAIVSATDWLTSRDDPEHVGLLDTPAGLWRRLSGTALVLLATVAACAALAGCGGGGDDDIVGPPPPATIGPVHCNASGVCR